VAAQSLGLAQTCEAKRDHKKKDNNKQQTEWVSISPKTRDRIRKKMNKKQDQRERQIYTTTATCFKE